MYKEETEYITKIAQEVAEAATQMVGIVRNIMRWATTDRQAENRRAETLIADMVEWRQNIRAELQSLAQFAKELEEHYSRVRIHQLSI